MACYADEELSNIMKTGSDNYAACQADPGQYPTGGEAGKAFCLFDKLDLVMTLFFLTFLKIKHIRSLCKLYICDF